MEFVGFISTSNCKTRYKFDEFRARNLLEMVIFLLINENTSHFEGEDECSLLESARIIDTEVVSNVTFHILVI